MGTSEGNKRRVRDIKNEVRAAKSARTRAEKARRARRLAKHRALYLERKGTYVTHYERMREIYPVRPRAVQYPREDRVPRKERYALANSRRPGTHEMDLGGFLHATQLTMSEAAAILYNPMGSRYPREKRLEAMATGRRKWGHWDVHRFRHVLASRTLAPWREAHQHHGLTVRRGDMVAVLRPPTTRTVTCTVTVYNLTHEDPIEGSVRERVPHDARLSWALKRCYDLLEDPSRANEPQAEKEKVKRAPIVGGPPGGKKDAGEKLF